MKNNYKLKAEAITHSDLLVKPISYSLVRKFVNKEGDYYLQSEPINLSEYLELEAKFGGVTAYIYE